MIKNKIKAYIIISLMMTSIISFAQNTKPVNAIYSGIPWYDNHGNTVSAHGAGIIKENDVYYLFGEFKSDDDIQFNGVSCYASKDLYNWTFENIVLPVQDSGRLGPHRIGERPKVLKCPKTGEYVMFLHTDNLKYNDQCVGYATSKTINGTYTFQGPILFNGEPIKKWDMGVFKDTDGSGYIVTHSGNLYKLADDYKSVTEQVVKNMTGQCESPIIFKKEGVYFWLGSSLTSWERNDNYYFTATSLKGPWKSHGHFAPKGSLTWNSQCTFVLPVQGSKDTTFVYMGDRWSFPRQNSAATYVWQPLSVVKDSIYLPDFKQSWQINTETGEWSTKKLKGKIVENTNTKEIEYIGNWTRANGDDEFSDSYSNEKNASISLNFKGTQIGIYGVSRPNGGYAKVDVQDINGKIIQSNIIEMYSKYAETSLKYLSPVLPKGNYKLVVSVVGDHGNWYKKDGTKFGSTDDFVSIDKIMIKK
ncbi:family 43 glycosylhydrolase [Wenyingzhuangia sp. IMCC45467]